MVRRKKLFIDNGTDHGTVILNWHGTPEREFAFIAEGFHLTAKDALAALRQNPHFGRYGIPTEDFRAYPIVFLYRHALELYMKAVLLVGSPMLAVRGQPEIDRERVLTTHSLEILRQDLERIFEAYEWDWDLGVPHFRSARDFREAIAEFTNVDAGSYAFRYPIDTKARPSLKPHFTFNIFEFCKSLDGLFPVLDGAARLAYDELQATWEMSAESREWQRENAE